MNSPQIRKVKIVCSHDCPDACSIWTTVIDGEVKEFKGDPDHPITQSSLCGKVNEYERVVNSEDRLVTPLKRTGPKGEGKFEPISWDEALTETAERIQKILDDFGSRSLLQYYYAGNMGLVQRFCGDALFNRLNATQLNQNICYYGADAGYQSVVGSGYGIDMEDVKHSDVIIIWGCNVVTTQMHLLDFIRQAKKTEGGAELIVIDPYLNRTAKKADQFVKIKPGTDAVLAFALAHEIDRLGMNDQSFIDAWTVGYGEFKKETLDRYPPEVAEEITGIPQETIKDLALKIAKAKAPVAKVGIGLGRNSNGAAGVRAICCLMGVVGSYHKLGGGVLYDSGCEFRLDLNPIKHLDWRTRFDDEPVLMTDLHEVLSEDYNPSIKFLYVHGCNPAATNPEQKRLLESLSREDLFTVVHERFFTDTCNYADIVLPAPTFAEVDDLYKSYGHLYLQMSKKAIEPRGESRSNLDVIQALGKKLGFDDSWFDASVEEIVTEVIESTDDPNFEHIQVEDVLNCETLRLNIPRETPGFKDGFKTRSKKLEFVSQDTSLFEGMPSIPTYNGDVFGRGQDQYPFKLITPPAHMFLNSSFGSDPKSVKREKLEPKAMIHPQDAKELNINDQQEIELYNDLGSIEIIAKVTEDTQPSVIIAEGTWWPSHGIGKKGINQLTSSRLTDFGKGSTFHDNRVAVRAVIK